MRAVFTVVFLLTGGVPIQAPGDSGCAQPAGVYRDATPWAQRLLAPERVWPLTTGAGVTVAVIGTGVDAGNAQFAGDQVGAGLDVTGAAAGGDCDGRGTFAAGIVAARPDSGTTFTGLAPGARVLPIRWTQATTRGDGQDNPDRLAAAIRAATTAGVDVVCVATPSTVDSPALELAVAEARTADVVVVSAAVAERGRVSYPTVHPAVLAVGAVARDGSPAGAETGDHIDVAAPGRDLVSLAAGAEGRLGHAGPLADATPYAAAFVAGVAALVRAYRPELTATEVVARLERTANAVPGGHDPYLGRGVVDLYAAVTAEGVEGPRAAPAPGPTAIPMAYPATGPPRGSVAIGIAVAGLLLAVLVGLCALAVHSGRTRRR